MSLELTCHPNDYCAVIDKVSAMVSISPDKILTVKYMLRGDVDGLILADHTTPEREDELWEQTCLELFLQADGSDAYYEWNFSPSSAWALYGFDTYRGERVLPEIANLPRTRTHHESDIYTLLADIDLKELPGIAEAQQINMGLSAVLEEASGHKSYWALAHADDKPNFHNRDCFTYQLKAADIP